MEKNIIVRSYKPGDEDQIVQLLQLVFNGWPKFDIPRSALEHWRWKFAENPVNLNLLALAEDEGEIVGCNLDICLRVKIGDNIHLCADGVDSATHPEYRGMGIYNRTLKLKEELRAKQGIQLIFAISNNPILKGQRERRKDYTNFPHDLIQFIKIRDIDLHLKKKHSDYSIYKKYYYFILKNLHKLFDISFHNKKQDASFIISQVYRFNENIDIFWNSVKDNFNFIIERRKGYLNWRYCDSRGGSYTIKQIEERGNIVGYSVLRINNYNKEYPEGFIVDLLALPSRLDIYESLIFDALNYFNSQNINVVYALSITNNPCEKIFKKYRFLKILKKSSFTYRYNDSITEDIDKMKKSSGKEIHFVYGDFDWI